ncbi:hypothetical protein BRARA_K01066, partial [Brassica rapa]
SCKRRREIKDLAREMSHSMNPSSSSVSGGGNWRRRRGGRERGIPKYCRCGEEMVIRTSGTAKNPGRLFHCCPNGSEGDKFHVFTWTDERVVEEIEDLKSIMSDAKGEMSELRAQVVGLEKQLERSKLMIELERDTKGSLKGCCVVL